MVNRCVNPACHEEFRLLNAGDLYAHERRSADTRFLWLCAQCAATFELYFDPAGQVCLRPRSDTRGNSLRTLTAIFGLSRDPHDPHPGHTACPPANELIPSISALVRLRSPCACAAACTA